MDHGERHLAIAFEEGEAHAVAIGEHHHVLIGKRRHFVGDEDSPSDFPRGGNLRAEHFEGVFLLAESIVDATEIGIGMIAALMVEGMPLATADELPLSMTHGAVGLGK